MRIDCHHHFWEMSPEWEAKLRPEQRAHTDVWLQDHGPTRLTAEMEKVGIERTVLVEAWDYDRDLNLDWMERAEELEMVGAVIGWADPFASDFGDLLDGYMRFSKFRGVRFRGKFTSDPNWLRRPETHDAIRELSAREGLSLDMHLAKPLLTEIPVIAEENPELPMVLNHLSNPQLDEPGYFEPWAALMEPLREVPKLTFKVSAITEFAGPELTVELLRPVAKFMVETYGCDRLMYGSNWPVCRMATEYRETFELTMAAVGTLSAADEARILGGTAVEYYRIS